MNGVLEIRGSIGPSFKSKLWLTEEKEIKEDI